MTLFSIEICKVESSELQYLEIENTGIPHLIWQALKINNTGQISDIVYRESHNDCEKVLAPYSG